MKICTAIIGALALSSSVQALPADLIVRDAIHGAAAPVAAPAEGNEELWKRKGGGSSGGRGSSGGSSSGGSSSGGSSGGTRVGTSGVTPAYGRGVYYGGGAKAPYRTGGRSSGGITPLYLGAGLAFGLTGLWLYSVYSYPYSRPWTYYNQTANANQTKPVQCLCQEYSECGCDENEDDSFKNEILGTGAYAQLNKTLVSVADINGTSTIILNGTLPNGTIVDESTEESGALSISGNALNVGGCWFIAALVGTAVFMV